MGGTARYAIGKSAGLSVCGWGMGRIASGKTLCGILPEEIDSDGEASGRVFARLGERRIGIKARLKFVSEVGTKVQSSRARRRKKMPDDPFAGGNTSTRFALRGKTDVHCRLTLPVLEA